MTHAQERLKERYGFKPTKKLMDKILRYIKNGSPRAEYVRPAGDGAAIYRVQIKRRQVVAVFNRRFQQIMTFLPEGSM